MKKMSLNENFICEGERTGSVKWPTFIEPSPTPDANSFQGLVWCGFFYSFYSYVWSELEFRVLNGDDCFRTVGFIEFCFIHCLEFFTDSDLPFRPSLSLWYQLENVMILRLCLPEMITLKSIIRKIWGYVYRSFSITRIIITSDCFE